MTCHSRDELEHQRSRSRLAARRRLRFESLLLELSAAFASTPGRIDHTLEIWLQKLARFIAVERASFWELPQNGTAVQCLSFYRAPGQAAPAPQLTADRYAWLTDQYRRGNVVSWPRVPDDIPDGAESEREHALRVGAKSVLSIPTAAGASLWILTFVATSRYRKWTDATIHRLRLVAQVFTSAVLRERAELALRCSEKRFRSAFQHSALGMALVATDGRWLETNTTLESMLGYTEAELRATNCQAVTHPDDLAADLELCHRTLAGEIGHFELEKRYIHKDGRTVPVLLKASLVRDADDGPLYFICQTQDFSERARAASEIDRLRFELRHSERVGLMGQLTASLAHELLQPITAILANAEALQHLVTVECVDSTRIAEFLDDIITSGHHAGTVIARVRALLRKERVPAQRLDFNQLVDDVLRLMRADLISQRVCLSSQLDPVRPEVRGDPVELQQVVVNLLLNAIEAMRNIPAAGRVLAISTAGRADEVELAVSDGGVGVDPELMQQIFQPFFSTKPGGMGIGLAICAEIARSHGGRLWAEHNPSTGMTFHLVLPIAYR